MGENFGRLTVLYTFKRDGKKIAFCRCSCGKHKKINYYSLTKSTKPTQSCGCLHKEKVAEVGKNKLPNFLPTIQHNIKYNTNFAIINNQEPPKNNTSGYKGVSWSKEKEKWSAYIDIHNKRTFLGYFNSITEAVKVRDKAEKTIHLPIIEGKNEK